MKYCASAGCFNLVSNNTRYCEQHFKIDSKPFEKAKRSNEGKYGARWARLVKAVKKRDGYKCFLCGSIENLSVHHSIEGELTDDLFYDENICLTLCQNCHNRLSALKANKNKKGA